MPKRIPITTLNASTVDIINTIRANASSNYQALVPEITTSNDIPAVGEVVYGYPAVANEYVSILMNKIALTVIKSMLFNNKFAKFKKGYLDFGETVEEVFVDLVKAIEFNKEKAPERELKRYLPKVRSAMHLMNYKAEYPITIEDDDLHQAFLSEGKMISFIEKILNSVYVSAEYDEFLLFKYLIIKGVTKGKLYPIVVGDGTDLTEDAVVYRATSNSLPFVSTKYNQEGVHTVTEKKDQYIFMDATYNAQYDVNVLASAFNMDKADFMGKLELIDNWDSFDNDRFSILMENTNMLEEVTEEELAIMSKVKAILVDSEWFQVYDNLIKLNQVFVASGDYRNYFLIVKKTVSTSPFSNAIVFVNDDTLTTLPETITLNVTAVQTSEYATIISLTIDDSDPALVGTNGTFIQTENATTNGVAVHKFGAYIFPSGVTSTDVEVDVNGTSYTADTLSTSVAVGDTITVTKVE